MRRKGRPESEERRINSENIAGGFPHYILHRHRCNLPLISVPRWLTKAIFCSQLRVGDRGGGQGRFGRSGWRVEDGERKRRCCGGVSTAVCGCQARPASPIHTFLLRRAFLLQSGWNADAAGCSCESGTSSMPSLPRHTTALGQPCCYCANRCMEFFFFFLFFFFCSRKKKTGGTLKMDNLEYSTIPSGRHLSRHSKGPLYWLLWASKMTFTATAVNKLDKGWYFAKAAARKRHRTELNAFKSGSTWRTRIMWAKTHGVEKACTVTGA